MDNIKVELSKEEFDFVVEVLGNLPSKSGAFIVYNKILRQYNDQQSNTEPV